MFVTSFLGILDTKSGEVRYVNAGHTKPLLRRRDGSLDFLEGTDGMAAGILPEFDFKAKNVTMHPGDEIIMYTDGISEAMNEQHQMYTASRLKHDVESNDTDSLLDTVSMIRDRVRHFAGMEPQSDDIAVMIAKHLH